MLRVQKKSRTGRSVVFSHGWPLSSELIETLDPEGPS